MDLLDKRQKASNELLQQRFIQRILKEESREIDMAQNKLMVSRGFNSPEFYQSRSFTVSDTNLQFDHLAKHRFVDMKTRLTQSGRKPKKSHPIHNRILYGHANNIVFRLSVEYTQRMKEMLAQEFEI